MKYIKKKYYLDRYYATDDGFLYTKDFSYEVCNQFGPTGKYIHIKERRLKGSRNNCGYWQVNVNRRYLCLHKIIAEVFVPNPHNYTEVNHIDGNKDNNSAENLEWCTRSHNIRHAYSTGLNPIRYGKDSTSAKYDESVIKGVYLDILEGKLSQESIGRKWGMPQITVSNIKTKRTWRRLTDSLDKKNKTNLK